MSLPMRSEVSEVYGAFKRGVDILAGVAALLALAVLFPFLALAIKLGDRGPILSADALGQIWAAVRNPEAANH